MASFDYSASVATAKRLIERFGEQIRLEIPTTAGEGYAPTVTWYSTTINAVRRQYGSGQIDGTQIRDGDAEFMIVPEATEGASWYAFLLGTGFYKTESAPRARLVAGGYTYHVVQVRTVQPGGTAIISYLQARR